MFLYDIVKGWLEDYLIVGVCVVCKFCFCFGLNDVEIEIVVWLIEYYLDMSIIV